MTRGESSGAGADVRGAPTAPGALGSGALGSGAFGPGPAGPEPRAATRADLEAALAWIDAPGPSTLDAVQRANRDRIRAFLVAHGPIALTRASLTGHLTVSCLLWDPGGERVLLHHHKKLDLWLQFGGHCDGDGDLGRVARRELIEESGIAPDLLSAAPVDFDVHQIPDRPPPRPGAPAEPAHLHLDVRFTAIAPGGASAQRSEESHALAWLTPAEARARGADGSLRRLMALGPPPH